MQTIARYTLILLTVMATFAIGALSGRVLCFSGLGGVAIEDVHCCSHDDDEKSHEDGDTHRPGDCVDIGSDTTLVREGPASPLDHVHALLAPMLIPPIRTPVLNSPEARPPRIAYSGHPPALDHLARLGNIILLA